MVYFVSSDKDCGWPFHELAPESAKQLLEVGDLLNDYLLDTVTEVAIEASANRVLLTE
jgi:hypothetical protein